MLNANPASDRLYGMMQFLLSNYANKTTPASAEPRGVVDEQDALDAVVQLAGFIDANTSAGNLSNNDGAHMAAMLMVIREHLRSLPVGLADRGDGKYEVDRATEDLQEFVTSLRAARTQTGLRG
ncbi:hypothetical protein OG689_44360 [Kitasatospora sp. NBC_00240]|uniref:hypothetical protein n=1 Tax=Kitasatospora sp. NBC_00240 TaxID=2903567 RepID=UPI002256F948|nr:hypothetical protein [Kitasatospora sp. NBC_00240]MCX5216172.1 hypothetical protein [Kitasatospora sp. NBC_00240]